MKLCLQLPFSCPSFSCSARKKKQQLQIQIYRNPKPKLNFPKSAPTPLLINQNVIPRSKIQAPGTVIEKLEPSVNIFASLLETCAQLKAIDLGIKVHNLIPLKLLSKNVGISSKLIRLYASNGYVEKAHELFDQMSGRNSSTFRGIRLFLAMSRWVCMKMRWHCTFRWWKRMWSLMSTRVLKGIGMIQVGEEIHRHQYVTSSFLQSISYMPIAALSMGSHMYRPVC